MKRLLFGCLLACSLFAAGTVQTATQQMGNTNNWVAAFYWTGDASTGSVPNTSIGLQCCIGYYVSQVEIVPGSAVAPTPNYSVVVNDPAGADVLDGAAAALSNTSAQSFAASTTATPIQGSLTLAVSGNSVASATGTVLVFMSKPGTIQANGSGLGTSLGIGSWQYPALQNGWSNSPLYPVRYRGETGSGIVRLGGVATVNPFNNSTIFTLPRAYWPLKTVALIAAGTATGNNQSLAVSIGTTGKVSVGGGFSGSTQLNFDGLTFPTT